MRYLPRAESSIGQKLRFVRKEQEDYVSARPKMRKDNTRKRVAVLLQDEMMELNGNKDRNMSLEQYRRQEVADVFIFALDLANLIRYVPDSTKFEEQLRKYEEQYQVTRNTTPAPVETVHVKDYGTRYERVKADLKTYADALHQALQAKSSAERVVLLKEAIFHILALSEMLFSLLGTNFFAEELEKRARNSVKYPAKPFSHDSGLTYKEGRQKGKDTFAGAAEYPLDLEKMDKRLRLYKLLSSVKIPGDYVFQLHNSADEMGKVQHFRLDEQGSWSYLIPVPINDLGEEVSIGNIDFYSDMQVTHPSDSREAEMRYSQLQALPLTNNAPPKEWEGLR